MSTERLLLLGLGFLLLAGGGRAEEHDPARTRRLVQRLDSRYASVARQARHEVLAQGPRAVGTCLLALQEGGFQARAQALRIMATIERERLGSGEGARYMPHLLAGLQDEAEAVRRAAVEALVYLGERGLEHVRAHFEAPGAPARRYLEEIEDTILRRRVEEALALVISPDGGFGTYEGAFRHVGELGAGAPWICLQVYEDPRYEPLSPGLRDNLITFSKVRYLAGSALYEICGDEIAPVLRRLYDHARAGPGDPEQVADHEATLATILSLHGETDRFQQELELRKAEAYRSRSYGSSFADVAEMYLKSDRNRSCVEWYRLAARYDRYLNEPVYLYNIACAYSRMGELELGLQALWQAARAGYAELSWLARDGDLDNLRGEQEFQRIVEYIEKGSAEGAGSLQERGTGLPSSLWELLRRLGDEDEEED